MFHYYNLTIFLKFAYILFVMTGYRFLITLKCIDLWSDQKGKNQLSAVIVCKVRVSNTFLDDHWSVLLLRFSFKFNAY